MKKVLKPFTAVLLSLALLGAAPHALAADNLTPAVRERLESLKALCEAVREEGFELDSEEAFEEAESSVANALSDSALTDEAAVAVLHNAQEKLRGVDISSVYGLAYPLETYYQFDDALFRDRFAYPYQYEDWSERDADRATYEELFYHYQDGRLDWVLAHTVDSNPEPLSCYMVLGNRVLRNQSGDLPFAFGYSVYDAVTGRFKSLTAAYETYERGGYAGLAEAMDACGVGNLLGDIDRDGRLTIKDATKLQRCLAELEDYPTDETVEGFDYRIDYTGNRPMLLSDLNRNGRHDIDDVTVMQKILAEC